MKISKIIKKKATAFLLTMKSRRYTKGKQD